MFNLQGGELIIILLLALVVLGPEKLPDAMRKAGRFYAELKKMSSGFQDEFRAALDEPMQEMRDTANLLRDSADFRRLQDGEREEKPKSAEMMAPASSEDVPTDDVPSFETGSVEQGSGPSRVENIGGAEPGIESSPTDDSLDDAATGTATETKHTRTDSSVAERSAGEDRIGGEPDVSGTPDVGTGAAPNSASDSASDIPSDEESKG